MNEPIMEPTSTSERNMPIREAAKLMAKSEQFVRLGLQRDAFPFGTAIKVSTKYTYYISPQKFYEYIGKEEPHGL